MTTQQRDNIISLLSAAHLAAIDAGSTEITYAIHDAMQAVYKTVSQDPINKDDPFAGIDAALGF